MDEVDVTKGENRVWFGPLCVARIDDGRCQIEVRDDAGRTHPVEVPDYLIEMVRGALGKCVQISCMETKDDDGNLKATAYFLRLLTPGEIGPLLPTRSWRERAIEQGIDPDEPPNILPAVAAMLPTRDDAVRFGRELEKLRGRKIFD